MEDLLERVIAAKKEALDCILRTKEIPRMLRDNVIRIASLRKEITFLHAQIAVAQESPVEREQNMCAILQRVLSYRKQQRIILQDLCKVLNIPVDDSSEERVHISQIISILNATDNVLGLTPQEEGLRSSLSEQMT